jgi:hypothetical protein
VDEALERAAREAGFEREAVSPPAPLADFVTDARLLDSLLPDEPPLISLYRRRGRRSHPHQ